MKIKNEDLVNIKSLIGSKYESESEDSAVNIFIDNFSNINKNKTEKQQEENYRLLSAAVAHLKFKILGEEKDHQVKHAKKRKAAALFLLFLGLIVAPFNGAGVASGVLSFLPFVLPLPAQIAIIAAFSITYLTVFIGFDLASINAELKTSFFRIVRLSDHYLNILHDLYDITQQAKPNHKQEDVEALKVAFIEIERGFEARKVKLTEKSLKRKLVEIVVCTFGGIALMCGTCLGVKGGALIFTGVLASLLALSGPATWGIIGGLIGLGIVLGLCSYLVLQRKGLSNLISRIWGRDINKFNQINQKITYLKLIFRPHDHITGAISSPNLLRRQWPGFSSTDSLSPASPASQRGEGPAPAPDPVSSSLPVSP